MLSRAITRGPAFGLLGSLTRTVALVSVALLAAFHGWLFVVQAAEGRLEDPWLVVRWLVAGGLVVALAAVRRRTHSIWNRRGLAVWVLAALLHGPALASDFSGALASQAMPEAVATSVLQSLLPLCALAVSAWMLAGLLSLRNRHARLYAGAAAAASHRTAGDGFALRYASRPPPPRR